jgi:hypothetical protein
MVLRWAASRVAVTVALSVARMAAWLGGSWAGGWAATTGGESAEMMVMQTAWRAVALKVARMDAMLAGTKVETWAEPWTVQKVHWLDGHWAGRWIDASVGWMVVT